MEADPEDYTVLSRFDRQILKIIWGDTNFVEVGTESYTGL